MRIKKVQKNRRQRNCNFGSGIDYDIKEAPRLSDNSPVPVNGDDNLIKLNEHLDRISTNSGSKNKSRWIKF